MRAGITQTLVIYEPTVDWQVYVFLLTQHPNIFEWGDLKISACELQHTFRCSGAIRHKYLPQIIGWRLSPFRIYLNMREFITTPSKFPQPGLFINLFSNHLIMCESLWKLPLIGIIHTWMHHGPYIGFHYTNLFCFSAILFGEFENSKQKKQKFFFQVSSH